MVRVGREANDVYLYGAVRISKTTLQTPLKLGQQRQDGILVDAKVLDTLSRYSGYEHKRYEAGLRGAHGNLRDDSRTLTFGTWCEERSRPMQNYILARRRLRIQE
jgi:hypothetical protein